MTPLSLKERIYRELVRRGDWVASTEIERIVMTETSYSSSNGARRLRDLFKENRVERQYRTRSGVKLAFYRMLRPEYLNQESIWNKIVKPNSTLTLSL